MILDRFRFNSAGLRDAVSSIAVPAVKSFYVPSIDHEFEILRGLCHSFARIYGDSVNQEFRSILSSLVHDSGQEDQWEETIDIKDISGICASKGKHRASLNRLRYSIYRPTQSTNNWQKNWDDLSHKELLEVLLKEIDQELGHRRDHLYRIYRQMWNGKNIVINTGASRRFAWLHSVAVRGEVELASWIEPIHMNNKAARILMDEYWCVVMPDEVRYQVLSVVEDFQVKGGFAGEKFLPSHGRDHDLWFALLIPREGKKNIAMRLAIEDSRLPWFDASRFVGGISG